MKIYLAGSIFYYGDELRNREWAKKIREAIPDVDLYSPIENTDINGVEGKKKFAGSQLIEEGDNSRLDNTDVLIACIDGDVIPSGTSCEIGIMREKIRRGDHKYVIGICTDNRECSRTHSEAKDKGAAADICEQQYSYQNLYTVGCIKKSGILVNNIEDAIKFLKEHENEFDVKYNTTIAEINTWAYRKINKERYVAEVVCADKHVFTEEFNSFDELIKFTKTHMIGEEITHD